MAWHKNSEEDVSSAYTVYCLRNPRTPTGGSTLPRIRGDKKLLHAGRGSKKHHHPTTSRKSQLIPYVPTSDFIINNV